MAPVTNRPAAWACPTVEPKDARASCEAVDKLNDYGADGSLESPAFARIDAHDPSVKEVRRAAANARAWSLKDSAVVLVDTTAWVDAPANKKAEFRWTSPSSWTAKASELWNSHSEAEVVDALSQAKSNAEQFMRNLYVASGGQLRAAGAERLAVRIVPTTTTTDANAVGGKAMPWAAADQLTMTPGGIDIGIDPVTLKVPTVEELTEQWNKGMQFEDERMRTAWAFLNPSGSLQSGAKLLHDALVKTVTSVAKVLGDDLNGIKAMLAKPATRESQLAAKQELKKVIQRETVARAPKAGQPAAASTEPGMVAKTIDSMSRAELISFVSNWQAKVADPNTQSDSLTAAMQPTRNVSIKARGFGLVATATGDNVDVIAQLMAKGNGARFTHLINAPAQTETYDVAAFGLLVGVANMHTIRVFAQVGGVLGENKVLGTGTLQEALAEHLAAKKR
jgi:hypothetical protein